ncbi:hypothetical protein T459_33795 [Capsicum annuum]|uniref:non-specific serine/threonine protein kinase n=1 Tax=Capsicum annuum TaxID=4072 RepID=A0A1U8EVK9_CAPAN|nr:putative late blight resistance protein homolog R1B-23 [Capsicum annuum]PHT62346.1 hypothetical protein T459_33795 [Capsicum annuum]
MNYPIVEALQQIEDQWGLDISETSEDRIKFLKREFTFLGFFLSLQSFIDLSYMFDVIHKVQTLFQDSAADLGEISVMEDVDRATNQLQVKTQMAKLEIKSHYLYPKVNKDGIAVVSPKSVIDLIDTVVVNLGDLLKVYCSSSLLFVPEPNKEIADVFKELKLLRNFVCFVSESKYTDFFTHFLEVVSYAGMVAWLYLPSNGTGENQEMNYLPFNLLQMKIKPTDPSTHKIYIDVLLALRFEWHPIIQIEHVAGFVETLQYNLKTLPISNPNTHQIAALQEMLNLLVANLSIQDLEFHLQDIDSVLIDSGLLVYSLCDDVTLGKVTIDLPGTIQHIKILIYHIIRKEFQSNLPRIHGLGYVDFVLNNLKEFQDRYPDSLAFFKTQLQMIQTELEGLQPFLRSVAEQQYSNELQHSVALLISKSYEVEYIVDACVIKKVPEWCLELWLVDIIKDIRAQASEIQLKEMVEVGVSPYTVAADTSCKSSKLSKTSAINENIVGFGDEIETLRNQLTGRSRELDIIPIVGMPGAGKTTLAKRLYFDKLVVSHFDIRAQCHVSPAYSKRDSLLSLLAMLHIDETSLHSKETDELEDIIYRSLHSRRYLIFLDDVWDQRVWGDLKHNFPDNNNGSRILLTTRNHVVANYAKLVSEPLRLRFLTYEESWDLLKIKVFGKESCSPLLENVGQKIARKCEGLPLSVVSVAGVLSKIKKTEECWSQVAKGLGSYIGSETKAIIEQSYKHLPYHLKPCILYFGTFLEDEEINVSKLTWLWTGEGFVKDLEGESLQNIAKAYLEDLISRNLVMNAKKSSDGKVKSCRIHGLLLDFCKRKAEEEHFLLWIKRDGNDKYSSGISSQKQLAQRRLVFYCKEENLVKWSSSCTPVDSVLYREDKRIDVSSRQVSQLFHNFKFLKVLDLESIVICSFPTVLVYLRYFSAQTAHDSMTSLISNLWNLETLILKPTKGKLKLPVTIWKMVKLRHLCIDNSCFTLNGVEGLLEKLEVLSSPYLSCANDVELLSRKTPNIQELICSFVDFRQEYFPKLGFLTRLKTLEIHLAADSTVVGPYNFPPSLRNLTLSNFFLGSCHESNISRLPNLHVLKLVSIFFDNDKWEVGDGEFFKLKVLKLVKCEFFEEWKTSDYAFPGLEHLVLRECPYLKEVPSSFQNIDTLKSIKVKSCNESVERSATKIKQFPEEFGAADVSGGHWKMDGSTVQGTSSMDSFLRKYKLGKTLGIGLFGKVKIAVHNLTGHKVVVKILNRKKIRNMEEKIRREIKLLRLLMHPHIIRLYEVIERPSAIYVVMEYAKSGELFDYIVEKGRLQEDEARNFFQQIISGVEYCHRNMVVHRDLRPENLLLDSKWNLKIADFGLGNIMRDGHFLKTSCGSPNYAAPEVISGKLYAGPEVDVWSCGVILYALLCGTLPFDDENIPNLFKKIKGAIYALPNDLSAGARDLIPRMLIVDPMKRITIPEIRLHPWFQAHLPRYLAVPPPDTMQQAKKIDEEILQEVVKMGFDRNNLTESLRNRVQNEGTVAYYLLLDNHHRVSTGYLGAEFQESMEYNRINSNETVASPVGKCLPGIMDYQQAGARQFPVGRKWALGLQSGAHPREIMTEVLKALQELNACWKKIGPYNMKCRWVPSIPGHHEGMGINSMHGSRFFGDDSAIVENDDATKLINVVKFEVQLYKTREGKYLIDLQWLQGSQFLFLDLCAAFLAQLRAEPSSPLKSLK